MTNQTIEALAELIASIEKNINPGAYIAPGFDAHKTLAVLRAAISSQPPAPSWQPIETAPEDGEFLVYMPSEKRRVQSAKFHPNVKVIGHVFAFDLTKPTHWMPIPPAPASLAGTAS